MKTVDLVRSIDEAGCRVNEAKAKFVSALTSTYSEVAKDSVATAQNPQAVADVKMNFDRTNLLEWLGIRRDVDFNKARPLGALVGFLVCFLILVTCIATFSAIIQFLKAAVGLPPFDGDTDATALRNTGLVLAALFGAPFVVWRTVVAAQQVSISDEALFNDKVNAAAQDLAARREVTSRFDGEGTPTVISEVHDDLVTRGAAIDRLEGLAFERPATSPRIARLLATYIRGNFPNLSDDFHEPPFQRARPRMDLQAAVDTIGRIHALAIKADPSNWRLNLSSSNFDGVNFSNGVFFAADFSNSRFEASIFSDADLRGCLFVSSLLNAAKFYTADMTGAKFDYCTLNRPEPILGGMVDSINMGNLRGARFVASDISAIDYLGEPEEIAKTFGTGDTIVSEAVKEQMPNSDLHRRASLLRSAGKRRELLPNEEAALAALEATGFQNWSPFEARDMSTGLQLAEFYEELGLNRWPYRST